jgi:predicted transposase YdaD
LATITGCYEKTFPGQPAPYLVFNYQVIRVWELSPRDLLLGGLGTLPLAPISAVTAADLPSVIEELKQKLAAPRYRLVAGQMWTAVGILMGLGFERGLVEQLLKGFQNMKESVTYQAIVEEGVLKGRLEGRLEEAKRILLRLGEKQFGKGAPATLRMQVESVQSLEKLENWTERLFQARSWEALVADTFQPKVAKGRNKKSKD